MKKICFFAGDITRCGGTERAAVTLANALAKNGFEVGIVSLTECGQGGPADLLKDNVAQESLFRRPVRMLFGFAPSVWRLKNYLKRTRPDILIGVDIIQTLTALPAIRLAGLKHSCRYLAWEHFHYGVDLGCRARRISRKIAATHADAVVVLTETDRKQYLAAEPDTPVVCIPNMIPNLNETAEKTENVPDAPFILSVGRIVPQKGFDFIPAIAQQILPARPGWKWIILGAGPDREKIEADLSSRGLADRVIFAGTADPLPYYRTASILAMPSRFEGFPMTLLEAMRQGLPAVAFDCKCGPADMIADGQNGFLVPCGNTALMAEKLAFLMDHPAKREAMSATAKQLIARFEPACILPRWEELFRSMPEERK